MHKKLASDLTSLAHSILQMKNKEDIFALKQKAYVIYEKLSVLAYVEEYINTTPNTNITKEDILKKIDIADKLKETFEKEPNIVNALNTVVQEQKMEEIKEDKVEKEEVNKNSEQPLEEVKELLFSNKDDIAEKKILTLEEELQGTIPLDVAANLFEKVEVKKSLNDVLHNNIQIELNDRIAFVKHLFNGNQEDYNRVISQLNTFKTEKEAKKFIHKMIKPDYNWTEKEVYETRLFEIIERRFI